jgi:lysophospholipase L1-like esterase
VGYQPGIGATTGYTGYVTTHLHMKLVNFGCAGATTVSILNTVGCPDVLKGTAGGQSYPDSTQVAAATAFLKAHQGTVGLITVSISGNDVTACAKDPNPVPCVSAATASIKTNVTSLAQQLRDAAGANVPIIGLTYPDVLLGEYVYPTTSPSAAQLSLAQLSVTAFKSLINPTLSAAYGSANGTFVDVTAKTGAYTPLTTTVKDPTFGTIPVAVASVCALTWYCAEGNIHARSSGYTAEGKMIVTAFDAGASNSMG